MIISNNNFSFNSLQNDLFFDDYYNIPNFNTITAKDICISLNEKNKEMIQMIEMLNTAYLDIISIITEIDQLEQTLINNDDEIILYLHSNKIFNNRNQLSILNNFVGNIRNNIDNLLFDIINNILSNLKNGIINYSQRNDILDLIFIIEKMCDNKLFEKINFELYLYLDLAKKSFCNIFNEKIINHNKKIKT